MSVFLVHKTFGSLKTLGTHTLMLELGFSKSFILLLFMFTELHKLEHDSFGLTGREMLKWLLNSLSATWCCSCYWLGVSTFTSE